MNLIRRPAPFVLVSTTRASLLFVAWKSRRGARNTRRPAIHPQDPEAKHLKLS